MFVALQRYWSLLIPEFTSLSYLVRRPGLSNLFMILFRLFPIYKFNKRCLGENGRFIAALNKYQGRLSIKNSRILAGETSLWSWSYTFPHNHAKIHFPVKHMVLTSHCIELLITKARLYLVGGGGYVFNSLHHQFSPPTYIFFPI